MSNSRKLRRSVGTVRPPVRGVEPETFWNGEPTPARRVRVVVADPVNMPLHWVRAAGLIGKTVQAVEVTYPGWDGPMYLYDEDGSGWLKVTQGRGSPRWGHRNLPVEFGPVDMPQACGYCRRLTGHTPGCPVDSTPDDFARERLSEWLAEAPGGADA